MMDTPITKKFFKKLELYLELKRQDKRSKKSKRGGELWKLEKAFLLWAIKGHWHMGTSLNSQYIKARLKEAEFPDSMTKYSEQVMQNLVFKKFARYYPRGSDSIQITNEGFLMAEVLEEASSKIGYVYSIITFFVWLTVILGFLKVLKEILMF